jgi:superfamily II DNA or RNA helicase
MWREIIAALPNAKVLGVTATPERLDGQGLRDVFDVLVIGPAVADLIESGFLSPFVTYAPPRSPDLTGVRSRMGDYATGELSEAMSRGIVIRGAVDEYAERCAGAPAIAFCVDIDHSQRVAAAFRERGYRAAHVDGETPRDERRALIAALGTTEIQVLCNCGLISEGLDVPSVIAAILLRPTKSLALYLQQVGRALRPAPGRSAR